MSKFEGYEHFKMNNAGLQTEVGKLILKDENEGT